MIGITERAKEELKNILTTHTDNPTACLRLTVSEEGQFGLGIDVETENDEVVEYEGSSLLLVEQGLADQLEGVALDVEDKDDESHLVLKNEPQ